LHTLTPTNHQNPRETSKAGKEVEVEDVEDVEAVEEARLLLNSKRGEKTVSRLELLLLAQPQRSLVKVRSRNASRGSPLKPLKASGFVLIA
jgi:hypothetical protein